MNLSSVNQGVTIHIPFRLKNEVNTIPSKKINLISTNKERAIESILYFTSFLVKGFFAWKKGESKWVKLQSKFLIKTHGKHYHKLIDLLADIGVIKINNSYEAGGFSKSYSLTLDYLKSGITSYTLTEKLIIKRYRKMEMDIRKKAKGNIIASYLINDVYSKCEMPSVQEIINHGISLASQGVTTKKGKLITYLGLQQESDFSNPENRSFVEDSITQYKYLTKGGLRFPIIGKYTSGGRVYDTFSLMSAWIRNLVTINGNNVVELDYKCLHPNLAVKKYGKSKSHINHQQVATFCNKSLIYTKNQHLSFFNLKLSHAAKSSIRKYYQSQFPVLLYNLEFHKKSFGYKSISHELFKAEVELMTMVILRLKEVYIPAIYVFDALLVEEHNEAVTRTIMNQCAIDFGVNTWC